MERSPPGSLLGSFVPLGDALLAREGRLAACGRRPMAQIARCTKPKPRGLGSACHGIVRTFPKAEMSAGFIPYAAELP